MVFILLLLLWVFPVMNVDPHMHPKGKPIILTEVLACVDGFIAALFGNSCVMNASMHTIHTQCTPNLKCPQTSAHCSSCVAPPQAHTCNGGPQARYVLSLECPASYNLAAFSACTQLVQAYACTSLGLVARGVCLCSLLPGVPVVYSVILCSCSGHNADTVTAIHQEQQLLFPSPCLRCAKNSCRCTTGKEHGLTRHECHA